MCVVMDWRYFSVCVFLILHSFGVVASEAKGSEGALRNEIQKGKLARILNSVVKDSNEKSLNKEELNPDLLQPQVKAICVTCTIGVNEILRLNVSEEIINRTIDLCVELGYGNLVFCTGAVLSNEAVVFYIHANSPQENGNDICGFILVGQGCTTKNPDRIWDVIMPNVTKPPVDEPPYPEPDVVPTFKILHLADTHYDPEYTPGADTQCAEIYLCCRAENGIPVDPTDGAGFWGDYRNCDLPIYTLELIFQQIAETHTDIDFIIWTGDIVPHNVWSTSRDGNLAIIHGTADLIVKYFPGIPVFPAVGNHEADPVNLFPQPYITDPEFDISWLYDELSLIWQTWLPVEAANSVAYSAYYSVQIIPGLRMLSVNTNYCYAFNWWLILDSTDIANELYAMAQELQKAEDIGERVYIIGHIPAGNNECSLTWSNQFNKIVSRYENTIVGIFYGHTHKDEFELYFDPSDPNRVYEIAYIAQSQTTYTNYNPGYKVYTVEGDFSGSLYRVLDHENWVLDLDAANANNETNLRLLYNAKADYGLPDLSPQSWLDLVYQMDQPNSTLFDQYYRNMVKDGTPLMSLGCDAQCKYDVLCKTLTSDNSDRSKCDTLTP